MLSLMTIQERFHCNRYTVRRKNLDCQIDFCIKTMIVPRTGFGHDKRSEECSKKRSATFGLTQLVYVPTSVMYYLLKSAFFYLLFM